jgi:hypothetical protein
MTPQAIANEVARIEKELAAFERVQATTCEGSEARTEANHRVEQLRHRLRLARSGFHVAA